MDEQAIANSLLALSGAIGSYGKTFKNRLQALLSDPVGTIFSAVQQQQAPFEKSSYWDRYGLDAVSGSPDTRASLDRDKFDAALGMVGPSAMGVTVYAPNRVSRTKLPSVIEEMKRIGAPTIRAYYDGEAYQALEGSHRLAAAKELGLTPVIDEMTPRQWLVNHDLYDLPDKTSVARALKMLSENRDASYMFPDLK